MSPSPVVTFREAVDADADELALLVRTAYRGEVGWTTEAAFLDDQRIDAAGVLAKIGEPDGVVLVATLPGRDGIAACCEVVHRGDGLAYFGMFAVDPGLQAAGLGRVVLTHAESYAVARWSATTMEMTVIGQRDELIAWYVRRGYAVTGERRDFPYADMVGGGAKRDDLYFEVLTKELPPRV